MNSIQSSSLLLKNANFKERYHLALKLKNKEHQICIAILKNSTEAQRQKRVCVRIMDCDCVERQGRCICNYFSSINIEFKNNIKVYPCGCGQNKWKALEDLVMLRKEAQQQ